MQETGDLRTLLDIWEGLAARERRCLLHYASRILSGQKMFGPLAKNKKSWAKETVEEAIDAAVYLAALAQDLADEK